MRSDGRICGAIVASLALLLAACGGGEEDSETDDGAVEAPEAAGEGEPAETDDDSEVADFYSGNTVRIIVGFSAGGGYDTQARLLANYLGDYIPGNPNVIVENVPGAGSVIAANQVWENLPDDGTTIGYSNGRILSAQVLGAPDSTFEAGEFQFVGQMSQEQSTCLVRVDAGVTSVDELKGSGRTLTFGGQAPGNITDDIPATLREVLEVPEIEIVTGYPGFADIIVAVEQGEVDGACGGWEPSLITAGPMVEAGVVIPLGFAGDAPPDDWPEGPMFKDSAETEEQRELLSIALDGPDLYPRPFYVSPNVPAERLNALREAFWQVMEDPEFIAAAEEGGVPHSPSPGEELAQVIDEMVVNMPDEAAEVLRPIQLGEQS